MDAPSDRLAWDRDGSILTFITGGNVIAQSTVTRRQVNSESEQETALGSIQALAVVFPVPTDLLALFVAHRPQNDSYRFAVETSKDTTNGLDGTWDSQFLSSQKGSPTVLPEYRIATNLMLLQPNASSSDVRGIRLRAVIGSMYGWLKALHLYGTPSSLATKDRLALWNPTTNTKTSPTWFDWGNTPRSSSEDRSFRVKNLSATLTANDIDVYLDALTPSNPSVIAMHTLSDNGGETFSPGLNLASLAPGQTSQVLILRRVVPANAVVSVWSARVAADVNLWSGV